MFIISTAAAIIIGYLLGGKLKNLENINLKAIYLIFISFGLEFAIVMCMRKGLLSIGIITYFLDLVMYLVLFIFVILNRKNFFIVIMGTGFLLNALPIFLNGGAMPVSQEAVNMLGFSSNTSTEGLYTIIDSSTKLWFLGDIIPVKFMNSFIISIGDIFSALGLVLLVITGMQRKGKGKINQFRTL